MSDIRNVFHMVAETWYMWQQHVIFCAETSYIWCRLGHVIFVGIRMLYLVLGHIIFDAQSCYFCRHMLHLVQTHCIGWRRHALFHSRYIPYLVECTHFICCRDML